jgi:hypothetical protein
LIAVPHKTLYVAERDISLWEAAQRVADLRKTSLSRIVVEALENDLPRAATDDPTPPETPTDRWAHIAADAA